MLLLTLRGTPTLYYADEIGLCRVEVPPDRVQDPWEKNESGLGLGRDPERTPMQWDEGAFAGFSSREPWLPLEASHEQCNVARLSRDETSILTLYRRLLATRRAHAALSLGDYAQLAVEAPDVLAYERSRGQDRLIVVLNLGREQREATLPQTEDRRCVTLSTYLDRESEPVGRSVSLRGGEGVILHYC
jgi:alpha-glucosidase